MQLNLLKVILQRLWSYHINWLRGNGIEFRVLISKQATLMEIGSLFPSETVTISEKL